MPWKINIKLKKPIGFKMDSDKKFSQSQKKGDKNFNQLLLTYLGNF